MKSSAFAAALVVIAALLISGCVGGQNTITVSSQLPQWTAGERGTFTIEPTGGTQPYTCAITSGSLPAGFVLNGCTLEGTPPLLAPGSTQSVSASFTITVTDSSNPQATGSVETSIIIIQPQIVFTLNEVTCTVDQQCDADMIGSVVGGTPPYHYQAGTFRSGTTPFGTSVGTDGHLIGIPTTEGSSTFGVCAVDSVGLSTCEQTTVTIEPSQDVEMVYSGSFEANGDFDRTFSGYTTCTFDDTFSGSVTMTLLRGADGVVSGTAEVNGYFTSAGVAGSTSEFTCLDSDLTWSDTAIVEGLLDEVAFETSFTTEGGSVFVGKFEGKIWDDEDPSQVSGTFEFSSSCCSGSALDISVVLEKE